MKKTLIGTILLTLLVGCNESPYPKGKNYMSPNKDVFIHQLEGDNFTFRDLKNDISINGKLIIKDGSIPSGHIHIKFDANPEIIPQEISLQNLTGTSKFKCLKCDQSMKDWKLKKS
ncbi:hypothetical protein J4H63_14890 [Vibrio alginolyticus]|uniref:hypothetical protein n=1 Tax=Vibrio alginolyticus TaxID=663 RepID=UPI001BD5EB1B|nr:hypothetical protein [Vibrio alginolyticus]EKY4197933.1 hypothetical protein [Vibrio harveyi]MBS9970709.1 hypothetical protein [Vibrio alginolyticus]